MIYSAAVRELAESSDCIEMKSVSHKTKESVEDTAVALSVPVESGVAIFQEFCSICGAVVSLV